MVHRICALTLLLLLPSTLAIPDSVWLALPPNSTFCFHIMLPDDVGTVLAGTHRYTITTDPIDPTAYWGIVGQTVSFANTNASLENINTFPFCFSTEGKKEGQSGANFTIRIAIEGTNISRTIRGGVTVSAIPDIDNTAQPASPRDVINSQADIFDIAFSKPVYFGLPDQPTNLRLAIQSYQDITLQLRVESGADVQIEQDTVILSAGQPIRDIGLTATAGIGAWPILVRADVVGCPACSKQVETVLYVNESLPEQAGWTLSLFPKSLDVEAGQSVDVRAIITNNGPTANFNVSIITTLPYLISQEMVLIESGMSEDVPIQLSLPDQPGLYSVQVRVSSDNVTKSETSYISVKELSSDLNRLAGDIKEQNPTASQAVDQILDQWTGQSLQDYQAVLASLQAANQTQPEQPVEEQKQPEGWPWWVWPALVVPIVVVAMIFILRRQSEMSTQYP